MVNISNTALMLAAKGLTVYADIFFIINFSMDLMIFILVACILRQKKRFWGIIFASVLSATLPIVQMIFPGNDIFSFIISCVNSLLACCIAFKGAGALKIFVSFAAFTSLSSLISFCLTKLFCALDRPAFFEESSGSGGIVPLFVCALSLALSGAVSYIIRKIKRSRGTLRRQITVVSDERTVEMSAYCDSGNLLREPIGGLPVIITGKEKMREIVPRSLHGVFFSSDGYLGQTSLSDARRVRLIPIMPVGAGGAHILFGYVPDKILLDGNEVSACVALDVSNSNFGGCDSLLPKSFIK